MSFEFNDSDFASSRGKKSSSLADLDSTYSSPVSAQSEQASVSWRSLFAFTRPAHVHVLLAAILASAAAAALHSVLAIILGRIFDVVAELGNGARSGDSALGAVSKYCLVLLGLGCANWLSYTAFLALWVLFGEFQADSARHRVFQSLLARDLAWFDVLEQGVSGLLGRVHTQIRELQSATSQVFGFLLCDALASSASLAIALYYSWRLTLVLLATLPLSFLVLFLVTRHLEPAIQAQMAQLEMATKFTTASITAIDVVKVFNGLARELHYYRRALGLARRHYLIQARCNSAQVGYIAFWMIFMFVIGFWYGLVLVGDGLAPGHVITTFYSTLAAFQSVEALVPQWLVFSKGMSAGHFLSCLASRPESPKSHTADDQANGAIRLEHCVGDVQFTNVSFAYPSNPSAKVLSKSSFNFPAGQTTFIVGQSGSGKSTIGSLLVKFYRPSTGQILIDGLPLELLDDEWVRENITLIQQTSILFNDTLYNNVALGRRNPNTVTHEHVLEACQSALLQSTISGLPQGLDTQVGSRGLELSGGQKQRVALARARLRDPTVLILDEVTSGLDQVSRSLVMDAIREWRKDKTTVIITHDLSSVDDDDYVYLMDSSSVVREGFKRDLCPDLTPPLTTAAQREPLSSHNSASHNSADREKAPRSSMAIPSQMAPQPLAGEPYGNRLQRSRPVSRLSLGVGAFQALGSKSSEIWSSDTWDRPFSSRKAVWTERTGVHLEAEKPRFSTLVNAKFSAALRCALQSREHDGAAGDDEGAHTEKREVPPNEAPAFVFGAAERRKDIPRLRIMARTFETVGASGQGPHPSATEASSKNGSLGSTLGTVWPTLGLADRLTLIIGLAFCFVGAAATIAFAYCLAQLMGVMWSPGDKTSEGRKWATYLVLVAVLDGLGTGAGRYLLERVGQAWVDSIRVEALARILQQPKHWFDRTSHSPGRINECLERNAEEMRCIVGRFVPIVVFVFAIMSTSILWALAVSWRLTLVSLAPLPLVMGAMSGYAAVSSRWESRCNAGAEESNEAMTEILLNIRVVRALNQGAHFEEKFRESTRRTLRLGLERAKRTSCLFGLYQSMSFALTALVFYYGTVLLAKEDDVDVLGVLQVINLLLFSIGTSASVLDGIPQLTLAQAAAVELLKYANLPLNKPKPGRSAKKVHSPLPLQTRGLTFSYPGRPADAVLRGVSLEVWPGECTAIVGQSGCGKSTVASILVGLYAPLEARDVEKLPCLSYAGVSFSNVDIEQLRSTMAYVPQSPFVFPASVVENIAYGLAPDSPYRRGTCVVQAAQAAGLHDFIVSLPQGYNTPVGDGGQALSGGQAQRLSIARALVRQPRLLVMDEPTSALDADSAQTIRQTVRRLVRSGTAWQRDVAVVVVTHSREMMQAADRIVVLESGAKVEEGSYGGLVQRKGPFLQLVSGGQWMGDEGETA